MTRRERPPGFMLVPGALLRDPAFMLLTPEQRGAYFAMLLLMWERGALQESDLPRLTGLGESWSQHAPALRPLFEVRRGKWSLRWLTRYQKRVRELQVSGHHGAVATHSKRRGLRESADGVAPTPSGSHSGSDSDSEKPKDSSAPLRGLDGSAVTIQSTSQSKPTLHPSDNAARAFALVSKVATAHGFPAERRATEGKRPMRGTTVHAMHGSDCVCEECFQSPTVRDARA